MKGAWWRWWRVPWADAATAVALVAAAATPVFLVGSAAVWRAGAEDDIAQRALGDAPLDRNGIDLSIESAFSADGVARADSAVRVEVDRLGSFAVPVTSTYTLPGLVTSAHRRARWDPRPGCSRRRRLDAITVVDQLDDTAGGVWVTDWFAETHDLELGDGLAFEAGAIVDEEWNDLVQGGGARGVFRIVGLYEPLWSSDPTFEPAAFWVDSAPPEVVPTFISAFNGPSGELVITDETTLLASGLTGVVRWRAPLTALPTTFDGVRRLRDGVRRFELSGLGTSELGDALDGDLHRCEPPTDAHHRPVRHHVRDRTVRGPLVSPLAAVRLVGLAIGSIVVLTAGWFWSTVGGASTACSRPRATVPGG